MDKLEEGFHGRMGDESKAYVGLMAPVVLFIIMELRTGQAGPFTNAIPATLRRHKPQALFLHQGRQLPPQNLYY